MNALSREKRVPGQRVKWLYRTHEGAVIEYTGVIVPLPDDHPLKAHFEETHEMVYVMPDIDKYPYLQNYPYAYWDFMIEESDMRGLYDE